jgi:hypothetical protein
MPSPKSGNALQLVNPADPSKAQEADVADPGQVEQAKAEQQALGSGRYGSVPIRAHKPGPASASASASSVAGQDASQVKPTHWISIKLLDADGAPVPGEKYSITLPDGSVSSGTLDANGKARVDGIADDGDCQITFPGLPGQSWDSA